MYELFLRWNDTEAKHVSTDFLQDGKPAPTTKELWHIPNLQDDSQFKAYTEANDQVRKKNHDP